MMKRGVQNHLVVTGKHVDTPRLPRQQGKMGGHHVASVPRPNFKLPDSYVFSDQHFTDDKHIHKDVSITKWLDPEFDWEGKDCPPTDGNGQDLSNVLEENSYIEPIVLNELSLAELQLIPSITQDIIDQNGILFTLDEIYPQFHNPR